MGEETVAWRDRVMCPNLHSGLAVGLEDEPRSSDINPCPSHTILLTVEFCSIYKRPWMLQNYMGSHLGREKSLKEGWVGPKLVPSTFS